MGGEKKLGLMAMTVIGSGRGSDGRDGAGSGREKRWPGDGSGGRNRPRKVAERSKGQQWGPGVGERSHTREKRERQTHVTLSKKFFN